MLVNQSLQQTAVWIAHNIYYMNDIRKLVKCSAYTHIGTQSSSNSHSAIQFFARRICHCVYELIHIHILCVYKCLVYDNFLLFWIFASCAPTHCKSVPVNWCRILQDFLDEELISCDAKFYSRVFCFYFIFL